MQHLVWRGSSPSSSLPPRRLLSITILPALLPGFRVDCPTDFALATRKPTACKQAISIDAKKNPTAHEIPRIVPPQTEPYPRLSELPSDFEADAEVVFGTLEDLDRKSTRLNS